MFQRLESQACTSLYKGSDATNRFLFKLSRIESYCYLLQQCSYT